MATTVNFLNCTQDPRTFPKTLHPVKTGVSCQIKGSINVLYPQFIIKYDATLLSNNANYVTWNNKCYYITDIELDSANQMVISCAIDVLNTYSSEIKACAGTCVRWQGENKPTFVIDKSLPIEENRSENVNVNFGEAFPISSNLTSDRLVLITI